MTRLISLIAALLLTVRFAPAAGSCIAIESDRILASHLAEAIPAFAAVPPETQIAYAPVPGVRRFFHASELERLALRYNVALPKGASRELCIERAVEPLRPQAVMDAMRKSLGAQDAHIEILDLSRFPVPRGEIEFERSALPAAASSDGLAVWRGAVHYAGNHRFAIWARVKVRIPSKRIVAVEDLRSGKPVTAAQVKLQDCEFYPSPKLEQPSLDQVIGRVPRSPIAAGAVVDPALFDAPKEVANGDIVSVEVQSGATKLALEGRAQSSGSRGQIIPIRNLATGKSFSARVVDRGRVLLNASSTAVKDAGK
ncbi:MAG TPA: flagellar basal body P-ring formation chaperone FlgA [Bryobacteraceae bacterium]|nr:flagellar basal body P-ring formation chaperone FlgA [Bryobacteraceae bacterium]